MSCRYQSEEVVPLSCEVDGGYKHVCLRFPTFLMFLTLDSTLSCGMANRASQADET